MGLIEDELVEVKKLAEHVIPGCRLVSCVKTMFPQEYPRSPLLIELKSKTLSEKLLHGLTDVCEKEIKKSLDETPLACCYDEITALKKSLNEGQDELKLKQKTSSLIAKFVNGEYYFNGKIIVPDNYPDGAVTLEDVESNFSPAFVRHMVGQVKEIARQCVEAPIKKPKPNELPFKPSPSLEKSVIFLIDCIKRLPGEKCQFCKEQCFPENPQFLEMNEEAAKHIERVYCGHLYHLKCLLKYMKSPPFGNKKCQQCGQKIFHHKWSLSDRLAETRWAHEQARERELAEVEDFFK